MGKRISLVAVVSFLTLSLAGVAQSWQGRMAGMGDPFGLVADESDFLIHPSEIADGKGINFYGNYRFNWQDVTGWNYRINQSSIATGALVDRLTFRTSGEQQNHDALVGAALPLGPGRLGLFFEYAGKDGDFGGRASAVGLASKYGFDNNLDAFSLRALYGLPVGSFKVGGEIQLAYQEAQNRDTFNIGAIQVFTNDIIGTFIPQLNTFPFQFPYDSKWWTMLFKGSLEGSLGPGKLSLTGRGGFIFSGDNDLHYRNNVFSTGALLEAINFKGDVEGWNAGGDLWWRAALGNGLSLPLLVRVDYAKRMWDGKGLDVGLFGGPFVKYGSEEESFQVEAGGGLEKDFGNGTRIAGGLYYNYSDSDRSFFYELTPGPGSFLKVDHTDYPLQKEHRILFKAAAEKAWCPSFTGRIGLNFFYGWVSDDYRFRVTSLPPIDFAERISTDGYRWGAAVALGGTIKFAKINVEPFVNGGYQKLSVDGDGGFRIPGLSLSMDQLKEVWSVGGGFSIRY